MPPKLYLHPAIKTALEDKRAVVALESTLITHGFPFPDNISIAQAIEETVREQGAVPATIAVLRGKITVGLTQEQLDELGSAKNVQKCSRADLPIVAARRETGATTVAGTMIIAHWAGIPLFATGGIGGVHRGQPFDKSTDLIELGRTPVTVVCAGAKAILDLPLTLEVLETQGVPVLGFQTNDLPAFYYRHSGLPLNFRVDSPQEVVDIIRARDQLGLSAGILVTIPVPANAEWPADEAQAVIDQALARAERAGVSGKAVTPYLLQQVSDLSEGRSKKANMALLLNNARLAAQIALDLASA